MNTVQRIAKNAGILLAANIINIILSFFYIIWLLPKKYPKYPYFKNSTNNIK